MKTQNLNARHLVLSLALAVTLAGCASQGVPPPVIPLDEPVMAQPMSRAEGLATAAIFCGKLNTPAPSIELRTRAVRALRPSFFSIAFPR